MNNIITLLWVFYEISPTVWNTFFLKTQRIYQIVHIGVVCRLMDCWIKISHMKTQIFDPPHGGNKLSLSLSLMVFSFLQRFWDFRLVLWMVVIWVFFKFRFILCNIPFGGFSRNLLLYFELRFAQVPLQRTRFLNEFGL